jgi:thiopeptide-type bacteriocin biosynthesis protein
MKTTTKNEFIIGDEWIYFKIYTGKSTSDIVISDFIRKLTSILTNRKIIDKWFFIRYSDPENHLRLRLHLINTKSIGEVITIFNKRIKKYYQSSLVWNIQIETYRQETQRYGFETMSSSEDLFFYDSEMVTNFITYLNNIENKDLRWLFCISSIDNFLNSFSYTIDEKINLFKKLKEAFSNEFNIDRNTKKQIGKKYKSYLNEIITFTDDYFFDEKYHLQIEKIISARNKKSKNVIANILNMKNKDMLSVSTEKLIISHIHMHTNRLFNSEPRFCELVLYDFLYKFYSYKKLKK